MSQNVWERFESIASADEILSAKLQSAPLEEGDFKMTLMEIAPSESKEGLPKVAGKFMMESGRTVFYNQMLQNLNSPQMTSVNIAEAVTFYEGLTGESYEFTTLGKFATDIESIVAGEDYIINVSYGKKDLDKKYAKLKVVEKLAVVPF